MITRVVTLFALAFLWVGQHGNQGSKTRNLDQYTQATPYVLSVDMPERLWQKILGSVRQSIWKNFAQHELAVAQITFISLEGYAHKFDFYVEPDSHGRWIVNVEETTEFRNPDTAVPGVTQKLYTVENLSWLPKDPQVGENQVSKDDIEFFEHHKLQLLGNDRKKVLLEL